MGNEFQNLRFYRAVCFTAAGPAEGAQVSEWNFLWHYFDDSKLVTHGQKEIFWGAGEEVRIYGVYVYVWLKESRRKK